DFVITWTSYGGQDGDLTGIFAQRYHPDGTPNGSEFQVNTHTTGDQYGPAAGMDMAGPFLIARTRWPDHDRGFSRGFLAPPRGGRGTGRSFRHPLDGLPEPGGGLERGLHGPLRRGRLTPAATAPPANDHRRSGVERRQQ